MSKKSTSKKSTIVRIIRAVAPVASILAPALSVSWLERLFLTPSRRPMKPRESVRMDRARQEMLRLDTGRKFPLYLWGHDLEGHRPTVLLVHGWAGRGSQLTDFVEPLLARGFRVATFDAPAHGEAEGARMSLPEMADVIECVARRIGPTHAILAHSLGAAATTIAMGRGLSTRRAVYVASPENPGIYLGRAARYLGFDDEIARRTQRRLEHRFDFRFTEARGTFLAPRLDVPLLLMHDLEDKEVAHRESERLAGAWPGAELFSTRGLGHIRILRDADVLDTAIGFLTAREGASTHPMAA